VISIGGQVNKQLRLYPEYDGEKLEKTEKSLRSRVVQLLAVSVVLHRLSDYLNDDIAVQPHIFGRNREIKC
jgi:hypothetical protein